MTTKRTTVRKKSMENVAVRNLDLIQETDHQGRSSRASALVFASFGGACIVFAALALMRSPSSEQPEAADPLGALVASQKDDGGQDGRDRIDADERDVYHALVKVVQREVDWGLHLGLHSIILPTPKLQVHPTGELELEPTY